MIGSRQRYKLVPVTRILFRWGAEGSGRERPIEVKNRSRNNLMSREQSEEEDGVVRTEVLALDETV